MSLRNTLPAEYGASLASVLNGERQYKDVFEPIFKELNPASVTSISKDMSKSLWNVQSIRSEGWWFKKISKSKEFDIENAPLFSVSGNGYIREQSIKKWRRINGSFELALMFIRLNDWVGQVRSATISKLESFMMQPPSKSGLAEDVILGCMDLILNPKRFGRSREIEFRVLNLSLIHI